MGAVATVLGGFWPTNNVSSLTQINGKGAGRRAAAMALSRKGTYGLRALMRVLDGAIAGTTASKTYGRVVAATELGGLRTTEAESLISRASVAGDITIINADVLSLSARTTLASPANGDKNPLGYR